MNRRAATRLQRMRQCQRALDRPAAGHPVGGGDAHPHRLVGGECGAHRVEHFERETHSVLQAAAVGVVARIRDRRQELVQQVTVGGVDFDAVQAEACGTIRRGNEIIADAVHRIDVERHRRGFAVDVRQRGRRHRLPAARRVGADLRAAVPRLLARALAAGVGELDRQRHRRIRAHRGQHPRQRGFVGVVVKAQATRRDAADGRGGGGFEDQQPRARECKVAEVDEVPVGRAAVLRRVLAHRRDHDPVRQPQVAQRPG